MIGDKKQKGFTLVEMLITAVVFSIIFGAATSVFVSAFKIQKYNVSQQQLLDQSSYAIEYMARALRMAKSGGSVACTNGANYKISNGEAQINFVDYRGDCQGFFWESSSNQLKVSQIKVYDDDGSVAKIINNVPLTSSRYQINNLKFSIQGDAMGDNLQPRVIFFMDIQDKLLSPNKPRIKMETAVSQRNLDE